MNGFDRIAFLFDLFFFSFFEFSTANLAPLKSLFQFEILFKNFKTKKNIFFSFCLTMIFDNKLTPKKSIFNEMCVAICVFAILFRFYFFFFHSSQRAHIFISSIILHDNKTKLYYACYNANSKYRLHCSLRFSIYHPLRMCN